MSKKVTVNEAKVLELWSKGYNDKQVRMYLGLSVSTWDRWKKAYKQRTEVSEVSTEVSEVSTEVSEVSTEVSEVSTEVSEVSTEVSEVSTEVSEVSTEVSEVSTEVSEVSETKNETSETSVPQWNPSTASNVGRGGVRYRYTDPVKYEDFRKQEAMRIMEQNAKQEITHKAPERLVKPEIPEELLQYDQTDVPYNVWTKYIDTSKGEHWGTFVMKYGRYLEPKKHNAPKEVEKRANETVNKEYFDKVAKGLGRKVARYDAKKGIAILDDGDELLF